MKNNLMTNIDKTSNVLNTNTNNSNKVKSLKKLLIYFQNILYKLKKY